ncbi:hypothetical protein MTR67_033018 [Solanum verrucosum]|uniref:Uncharacterized protein n=1 Tax=Solanum verrucosum TaxID=315347 RepID=A0AAF0ZIQ0_SOLVR|nr:hypothetical protein MTR67_033018 [Solanum verrucosum]
MEEGYSENAPFSIEDLMQNDPVMKKTLSYKPLYAAVTCTAAALSRECILHQKIMGSALLIDKYGMLNITESRFANYFNHVKEHSLSSQVVTFRSLTFKIPNNVKYPSMNLTYIAGKARWTMTENIY